MPSSDHLRSLLPRYWGYSSFRPGQLEIASAIAAGQDACVIMPTGGGKSLCYQLPAISRPDSTAIVISPLIALMQDQVAQLQELGIPAAVWNSSLAPSERESVRRSAQAGNYRLLYLSPESLAQDATLTWLKSLRLSFFVIDEAHCISDWGHDFRPEYRLLGRLRREFPSLPIAAFTASATQRVRHDILEQLALREPHKFIASFYRPNLRYSVRESSYAEQLSILLNSLRNLSHGSAIVYASTIRRVESVVEFLKSSGISAIGYHGQMDSGERRRNQLLWSSDEIPVAVGTLAFGLGINKPNVRKVIHLALPKSVEQYYQEAGRAGRDGLPADCLLLWQKRDAALTNHFISQIENSDEKKRAALRLHQMLEFAEGDSCRQFEICRHFGELPKWTSCGKCDACTGDLKASLTEEPAAASPQPRFVSTARRKSVLKSEPPPQAADADLWQALRHWRLEKAREKKVSAFIILHNSGIDELCETMPSTLDDLRRLSKFGPKKTGVYGQEVLRIIAKYREEPVPSVSV